MRTMVVLFVIVMLSVQPALAVAGAVAQSADTADVWRTFAENIEVGATVKVRLHDGRKFTATLVQAQPDALWLQPRTRVPVPVQPVAYDSIVSIERARNEGIGAGKAAAIGVATGVGAFLATMLIFVAAIDD